MKANFWLECWQRNEIGFHEAEIHPLLLAHWSTVLSAIEDQHARRNVFVPLCGKSRDMIWLMEQGHHVYGVELSAIGVEAFFSENNIAFEKSAAGELTKYVADQVTIFSGDIFALTGSMVPEIKLFYDRAALVALPPGMRNAYAEKVISLLGDKANGLLISLEYAADMINPPPHSLDPEQVEQSYGHVCDCELLGQGVGEVKGKPCTEYATHLRSLR